MSKVLLSFSGNKLNNSADFNIFPFYEGVINALKRNGNDVQYMIVNEFVSSYTSRSNVLSDCLDQSKLDDYIKNQNFDLIIAFNNALYDGYVQTSDIPFIVWGVDPISVYADKEKLLSNKGRYIWAGNCDDDYKNIYDHFNPDKVEILRFATDIRAMETEQDYSISFCGSLWKGCEKDLLNKGMSGKQLEKIISLLRADTNISVKELNEKLSHNLLDETQIFWLLNGIATTDRISVLSELVDLGLHCFGLSELWYELADTNLPLACAYDAKLIYNLQSTQDLLNRSKIGFNMSHIHANQDGFSFRIIDTMASNACLVTDYKTGYEKLFGKYVKLPTFEYGNPQSARKICEYLLNHEDERADIVKACQKAIDAEYRFEHRFKQIEEIANVKLFDEKPGSLTRIEAKDFIRTPQKTSVPVKKLPEKKKSLFYKILRFPGKLQVRWYKRVYSTYFSQIPKSMEIGFNFCDRRFRDVLYRIENGLTSFVYPSYHKKIEMEAYIAKVSRGYLSKDNEKIRVVFLFQEASYWPSVQSLYENLKNDDRFEVFVVAIPVLTPPDLNKLELKPHQIQFLEENHIEYIDARCANDSMFDIYNLKPDYVFVQIHFDRQRVLEYKTNVMQLYTKVCLIPHAFLLSASDDKELIYQQSYFRIFVPNEYHAKQLSSVIYRSDNIEITGYPRFDLYADKLKDSPLWKISKDENPNIKRIIWSPHWWAYGHSKQLADSVLNLWDYFYNYAQTHNDVELIIKPHPNLFNGLVQSKYISQSKAETMISAINDLPNASVYTGGNYIDLFKTADLIVNNSISFLAEWLPSEKPMIFFDTERKFELNEMAEAILDVYYHAFSISELDWKIDDILDGKNDEMKAKRLNLIEELNLKPANAAEKIKESLIKHKFYG